MTREELIELAIKVRKGSKLTTEEQARFSDAQPDYCSEEYALCEYISHRQHGEWRMADYRLQDMTAGTRVCIERGKL